MHINVYRVLDMYVYKLLVGMPFMVLFFLPF